MGTSQDIVEQGQEPGPRVARYDEIADWYRDHVQLGAFHRLVVPPLVDLAATWPAARVWWPRRCAGAGPR
jgi:hypothetical protein